MSYEEKLGPSEPTRSILARDIFTAWLACQMGVSLSTARKHADDGGPGIGTLWLHVADYVWMLNQGYAPADLKTLKRPVRDVIPPDVKVH